MEAEFVFTGFLKSNLFFVFLLKSYPTGDTSFLQQTLSAQQQPIPPPPSKLCSEWQVDCEKFLLDSVTDLMVVNGLTHELLMTGSRNGLLKVNH